ncbi:hypothetical protein M0R19_07095 [Candidatus Pacearchaeota archaeon]|jgi:hypothetical protein|nr:hypothetical protein [Candidatus Pacearchaeota archaeon]
MTGIYDLIRIHEQIRKYNWDRARKEYIDNKMRKINRFEESGSPYDLTYIGKIIKIHRDAKRLFG